MGHSWAAIAASVRSPSGPSCRALPSGRARGLSAWLESPFVVRSRATLRGSGGRPIPRGPFRITDLSRAERAGLLDMANLWPDAADTQTLLDRARSGDADAVDQLLARHRPALRRAVDLRLDPALAGRLD